MSEQIPDAAVWDAAEAIEDAAISRIGRDLGTVYRNDIVRTGLETAAPYIRADERARIAAKLRRLETNHAEVLRWAADLIESETP